MNEYSQQIEQRTGRTLLEWNSEFDQLMLGLSRIDNELNSEVIRILKGRVELLQENLVSRMLENK